jgi:hypothetical protein
MPAVDLPHHESWHPLTPHEASSKPIRSTIDASRVAGRMKAPSGAGAESTLRHTKSF